MGFFSGFSSLTSKLTNTINNGIHAVTGNVNNIIHTAETKIQSAVTGLSNVGHEVGGVVKAGAQGGLNALNTLGVPDIIKGLGQDLVHDLDIPANLNGLTGPVLSGGIGIIATVGVIAGLLILTKV